MDLVILGIFVFLGSYFALRQGSKDIASIKEF